VLSSPSCAELDFVLAGRRAEQVASAVSLSEKWKLQRTAA
jgi:hypothetical protein